MALPGVIKKLDEVVVNRIAAGEVIQRPANAIKEMLENSIDAGSKMITVTVKSGGMKMLQIQDNGTGIRQDDLGIVAERFTTSKLREFRDLSSISTYGFRGEALASISHVAHLSILTKTRDSACGFKCEYRDSVMTSGPTPMASNQGTTITVEDLFYNIPTRRAALRSATEEHNKIVDVISKYAIHNAGVGFTLKKQGESGVDVKTHSSNSVVDNIKIIYGPSVAKELIEYSLEDDKYKFKCSGHISNVNYNIKKMIFLLFINNRLVDCSALKRAIEQVYANYLPKGSSPFVYMSLHISPQNLDVNVHPTKHEVFFLHQDSIIEKIQHGLEERLLNSNSSRTFQVARVLPGAGATLEMFDIKDKEKAVAAKDMIRTDANLQKLDKFFNSSISNKAPDKESKSLMTSSTMISDKDIINMKKDDLDSVKSLKKEIVSSCSTDCKNILANHTFVGCVDRELALFQHETKLFLVNTTRLTKLLFKQLILTKFGEIPVLRLCPPPRVLDLVMVALNQEECGWKPEDGEKELLANNVVGILSEKRDMLAEYFSLEMDVLEGQLHLTGIPLILEDFCPWFGGLPLYIVRLATEVDWEDETNCFDTFSIETAQFYCCKEISGQSPRYDLEQHGASDEPGLTWQHTVEYVLYPAIRKLLLPPKECLNDRTLVQVANLPDLYRVFERC